MKNKYRLIHGQVHLVWNSPDGQRFDLTFYSPQRELAEELIAVARLRDPHAKLLVESNELEELAL